MSMALRVLSIVAGILFAGQALAASQVATFVAQVESSGRNVVTGGTVVPFKEVVLSAKVPGRINFVAGEEGASFKAGEQLIVISNDDIQARRRAAWANLQATQAALNYAQVQYRRELLSPKINNGTSRLSGFGMPSMFDQMFTRPMSSGLGMSNPGLQRYSDLQGRYNGINQAGSALLAAKARMEELDANLRDTRQLAPFDGIIVQKLVETGTTVQPGTPLLKFAYVDYLRIQAEVPVRLVSSLQMGSFLSARIDAGGGAIIKVRVAQIFPVADEARHTVTVKFDLPRGVPGGPGMYAEVHIPDPDAKGEKTVVIPRSSVVMRGSLPGVYVLKNDEPVLRMVRLGRKRPGDRVGIISGIAEGDQVVTQPVGNGMKSAGAKTGTSN